MTTDSSEFRTRFIWYRANSASQTPDPTPARTGSGYGRLGGKSYAQLLQRACAYSAVIKPLNMLIGLGIPIAWVGHQFARLSGGQGTLLWLAVAVRAVVVA